MNQFLDAIEDNRSITELSLRSRSNIVCVDAAMVRRLVNEHPALVYLCLFHHQFTANDAIAMIRQLHSLQEFRFFMVQSESLLLQSQLQDDGEWMYSGYKWDRGQNQTFFVHLKRRGQQE